jgi:hypothetical protein
MLSRCLSFDIELIFRFSLEANICRGQKGKNRGTATSKNTIYRGSIAAKIEINVTLYRGEIFEKSRQHRGTI